MRGCSSPPVKVKAYKCTPSYHFINAIHYSSAVINPTAPLQSDKGKGNSHAQFWLTRRKDMFCFWHLFGVFSVVLEALKGHNFVHLCLHREQSI